MNKSLYSNKDEETKPRIGLFPQAEGVTWCFIFGAEALAVVVINIFTLLVFLSNKHLRKRSMVLLINLTFVDLLIGAFCMPDHLFTYGRRFGLWATKAAPALEMSFSALYLLTLSLSLTNLATIALERLFATVYPFSHQTTKDWVYGAVTGLVWCVSGLVTCILMILFYQFSGAHGYWVARLTFIIAMLFGIFTSYLVIFRRARCGEHGQNHRRTAREKRLTKMLFMLTAVSLVTWLPLVIFATLATADALSKFSGKWTVRFNIICAMLYYFNSMVNPIVYTFRLPRFKRALFKREKNEKKTALYLAKNNRQSESSC